MALYEYECPTHGVFEKVSGYYETVSCPECGIECERIMSVPALIKMTEALHTDSGIPVSIHKQLEHKNKEKYEMLLKRQGKQVLPEDM